jgi:hypothetical protein
MDFSTFGKTAIDTVGTTSIIASQLPPSVIEQTPIIDQFGASWQAPVIGLASSVIIQLAIKGAKFLVGLLSKKISPKSPPLAN